LYAISSDARGKFGCTPGPLVTTFEGPLTCTGPTSDFINGVMTDEWPALTTQGRPIAGPGVNRHLLGTVYRAGIGRQVTYAGHPLYLFDPPSSPFVPAGEGFLETVLPLPPWHGLWDLISARSGRPDPGVATIKTGTLPDGAPVVAAEEYPNVVPGGVAITAYTYSRDHRHDLDCRGACAVTWIPVLTTGPPQAGAGISAASLGVVRRRDGSWQVTYKGKPLYLYSQEQAQFASGQPLTTGTVGNGNGLSGPHGGTFSDIPLG
jgi:predicted lipoprotein with Yx(FWY)xxD motif